MKRVIWYFLAGMIAGAAGLWTYANIRVKTARNKTQNAANELMTFLDELRERHPEFYRKIMKEDNEKHDGTGV